MVDIDQDGDLDALVYRSIWLDIDNDGRREEVDTRTDWFESTGSAEFVASYSTFPTITFFTFGDIDRDGDLDVITNGTQWYENRPIGDANNDGVFNSTDLVLLSQAGKYENEIVFDASFEQGDWNNDHEFTSADLVLAFQAGNYRHE